MDAKYLDDWELHEEFKSPGRTISETDVVMFAGLTGDYNELHTNEQFMQGSQFGRRIAHGLLGLSLSHGLLFRTGCLEGTVIALLGVEDWRFSAPIFPGDTLHVKFKAIEITPSKSKPDRGVLKLHLEMINQNGTVVQSGRKSFMMKRKGD